jgi:hypothetical protein
LRVQVPGFPRSSDRPGWSSGRSRSCPVSDRLRNSRTFSRQIRRSGPSLLPPFSRSRCTGGRVASTTHRNPERAGSSHQEVVLGSNSEPPPKFTEFIAGLLFSAIKVENKGQGSIRSAAWVNSRAAQDKSKTSRAAERFLPTRPTIKVENKVDIKKVLPLSM